MKLLAAFCVGWLGACVLMLAGLYVLRAQGVIA